MAEPGWSGRTSASSCELQPQQFRHVAQRGRHPDDREHREQAGRDHDEQRRQAGPGAVQAAHALGIDEDLADAQAREERRGHAFAVAIEELDEVELRADRDDQPGALLGGDQQRDVLARAGRGNELEVQAQLLQAAATGRAAVGVGVHDELRAAAQRRLAGRVHVADDHVRGEALLEQGLGAAVDGDDHRAHVADERPQGAQVALVADAADDHERRSDRESRWRSAAARSARPAARAPRACARSCCGRSARAPRRSRCAWPPSRRTHARRSSTSPRASSSPPRSTSPTVEPTVRRRCRGGSHEDRVPVGEELEQRVVGEVHEQDARFDEQLRPEVRVGAARGGAAVEHRDGARRDQLLGRDPIDVQVIDHRDLAAR